MTPTPPSPQLEDHSTAVSRSVIGENGRATVDMTNSSNGVSAGVDNVAYFRPAADDKPDRHQLPPSALTPVQFEMSYGMPTAPGVGAGAVDDGMSSKENLLTPRGKCDPEHVFLSSSTRAKCTLFVRAGRALSNGVNSEHTLHRGAACSPAVQFSTSVQVLGYVPRGRRLLVPVGRIVFTHYPPVGRSPPVDGLFFHLFPVAWSPRNRTPIYTAIYAGKTHVSRSASSLTAGP